MPPIEPITDAEIEDLERLWNQHRRHNAARFHTYFPALAARIRELEAHVERLVKAANGLPCWTPGLRKVIDYDPLYGPSPKWYPSAVLVNAEPLVAMREALAATPAVSLSAIKAKALRDAGKIASNFSIKPDRSIHPDIAWEDMNESTKIAAHTTAQQISWKIYDEAARIESEARDGKAKGGGK